MLGSQKLKHTVSQSQGGTSLSFPSSMALEGPFSRWPGDEMGVRQGTAPVCLEHSGLHELSIFCVPGVDIKDNRSQHQQTLQKGKLSLCNNTRTRTGVPEP